MAGGKNGGLRIRMGRSRTQRKRGFLAAVTQRFFVWLRDQTGVRQRIDLHRLPLSTTLAARCVVRLRSPAPRHSSVKPLDGCCCSSMLQVFPLFRLPCCSQVLARLRCSIRPLSRWSLSYKCVEIRRRHCPGIEPTLSEIHTLLAQLRCLRRRLNALGNKCQTEGFCQRNDVP